MNITKMRKLDLFLGVPICLLLVALEKTKGLFYKPVPREKQVAPVAIEKILVMKFLGMGSIILATPMLRAIKKKFPNARITFLTFERNKEVCELFALVDDIEIIDTSSFANFAFSLMRAIFQIRARNYDVVIDMEFFSKFSMIVSYLSGTPIRVGYFLPEIWREILITNYVYYNVYRHATENFLALANAINAEEFENKALSKPMIREETQKWVKQFVEEQSKLILINVNASELSELRRWPKENFGLLVNMIIKEYNPKIIFIGTEGEKDYTDSVIESLINKSKVTNLAGKLTSEQLSALFTVCDLFITNDSGPLHLAVSVGTPTISFFGPESPILFGPIGEQHKVLYKNLYCSPCLNVYNGKITRCNENKCLTSITVAEVFNTVKDILKYTS